MPLDLKIECDRLLQLGTKGQNPVARATLHEALRSKWEGVQITAARALAKWGDSESLAAIRALMIDFASKEAHWSATGAVADALAPHLHQDDIPWVLDFYFSQSKRTNRFALTQIFSHLPPKQTIAAINERIEARAADPRDARLAVNAIEWFSSATGGGSNNSLKPTPLRGAV